MSTKTKALLYYFFLGLQLITVAGLLLKGKVQAIQDVVGVIILFMIYLYFERRLNLKVSNYIRGSVLLTLTIHTLVGKFLNFYQTVPPFDNVLHGYGTYSVSLFIYAIFIQTLRIDFSARLNKFIFILLIGMSAGVAYEIMEFLLDVGLKPDIPNQAGLIDTNLDMISDLIGSFAAAFHECFIKSTTRISPNTKPRS